MLKRLLNLVFKAASETEKVQTAAEPTLEMGYRYVRYSQGGSSIELTIEPMMGEADLIYIPDDSSWTRTAPNWARARKSEILEKILKTAWRRSLTVLPSSFAVEVHSGPHVPLSGSLEDTAGGREFENKRLFNPSVNLTPEQVSSLWARLQTRFAEQAQGEIHFFVGSSEDPLLANSVANRISIPVLRANPNVKLVIEKVAPRSLK
ncbi:MAG: hypothetical protein H7222_12135 [Methylotenera sp.]|nr:hypothetical protein [Oligoflexia bacterium]